MSAPAELRRRVDDAAVGAGDDVLVAQGPLIIMAYALTSMPDAAREACTIATAVGDYSASEAAALLRHWSLSPQG
ncbi:hypothetical protein [Sphingomonas hengshuiensis]|uniref:Uncharacterized protein n=1 Tax=Sphingomonas hengshuiensis TaxID=1609977 RepID=A0A7U4J6D6_9SPHN|nr:hypothetical protein [Sphingomonas hengshuiensis]AJP71085.1 hypothetical protein TS85_03485 [Sphingomonas hengshuiensis]